MMKMVVEHKAFYLVHVSCTNSEDITEFVLGLGYKTANDMTRQNILFK